jgi:hypothetical protein
MMVSPADMLAGWPGSDGQVAQVFEQAAGPPVPARMRQPDQAGHGWLPGTLRLAPGSLLWVPDPGTGGTPVELAAATMIKPGGSRRAGGGVIDLQTQAGRVQLELDAQLFELSQELVTQAAADQQQPGGQAPARWVPEADGG